MSPISEEELRARLRGVDPSPALPGLAGHLIQQGRFRRRRQRWMTGIAAAAAVAVIGGGALVLGDTFGPERALPATPTPTVTVPEVTPTVTSTASPSATLTTTPSASPTNTPSATTTTSRPTSTPSSTPSASRSVALKPVTLLHQGNTGWVNSRFESSPCVGEAQVLPQPQGYEELKVIWDSYIAGANRTEGLVVFPSAGAAVSYMESLRVIALSCNDESSGEVRTLVQPLSGPWGDGIAVAQSRRDPHLEGTRYTGTKVTLFARVGRAVVFADYANKSELVDSIEPEMIGMSRPAIDHVVPQLCRYTKAGC